MKKTFHYLITTKQKEDPILGKLQVECKDNSPSTTGVIVVFFIIGVIGFYASSVLEGMRETQAALFIGVICTTAALYLLYSTLCHGVFFYEYGYISKHRKVLYDDIEYIDVKREYYKKGHVVGRMIWDFKLKGNAKPVMIDSRDFPSLMGVIEELCRQCDLKKKVSEEVISESD